MTIQLELLQQEQLQLVLLQLELPQQGLLQQVLLQQVLLQQVLLQLALLRLEPYLMVVSKEEKNIARPLTIFTVKTIETTIKITKNYFDTLLTSSFSLTASSSLPGTTLNI